MGVIVLFMAGLALYAGWWLSHQRLMAKPWLEEGVIGEFPGGDRLSAPPATIGLGFFLVVAGSLFALLMSAYVVRMQLLDWRPLPFLPLLWFNTGVLVLSSVILQWAQAAARRGDYDGTVTGVLCAGVSAVVFLIGQLLAWRQLIAAGYVVAANPANSFFYLVTTIHGLHLLGGLVALGRTIAKLWRGADLPKLRLSVELCALYWHFLLLVWLMLLGLLTGWTVAFLDFCGHLIPN